MKLLVRWIITILALVLAVFVLPGIRVEGNAWIAYGVMAVVLGLVNAIVRPILKILTCPLRILTLGLFTLVINAFTLWLAALIAQAFDVGFYVDNLIAAFLGALIVSAVTVVLSVFIKDDKD